MEIDPRFPAVGEDERRELLEVRRRLVEQAPPGAAADPVEQRDGPRLASNG